MKICHMIFGQLSKIYDNIDISQGIKRLWLCSMDRVIQMVENAAALKVYDAMEVEKNGNVPHFRSKYYVKRRRGSEE